MADPAMLREQLIACLGRFPEPIRASAYAFLDRWLGEAAR
jgi:hypothetical protein